MNHHQKKQLTDKAWILGFVTALAEMHRLLARGNDSAGVVKVARAAGVTLEAARLAGAVPADVAQLERAGVDP